MTEDPPVSRFSGSSTCSQPPLNTASAGASTALAVTVFADLDDEIRKKSNALASLDDVLRALMQDRGTVISLAKLKAAVKDVTGTDSVTLQLDKLPGCRSIEATDRKND